MRAINSDKGQVKIDGEPSNCPFCHRSITPNYVYAHSRVTVLEVMYSCPAAGCHRAFIAYYDFQFQGQCFYFNRQVSQGTLIGREFSETIIAISPAFSSIYNESYNAEQQHLLEICGVGYRKALEFLIKDYTIMNFPDDKDKIEKKLLSACISEYVNDSRVKSVAKRAVWLGNDETHYVRKWENKDLEDLKKLIDLTLHWIEMESLTKSFESEMPG